MQIVNPDAQFSLRDNVEPLYRESIDLSLRAQQLNFPQLVDRIDALKLLELENFLQCPLIIRQPVARLTEDPGAVVFYPIILAGRLDVIIRSAENSYLRFVVSFARSELQQTIDTFRLSRTQHQPNWLARSQDRQIGPTKLPQPFDRKYRHQRDG